MAESNLVLTWFACSRDAVPLAATPLDERSSIDGRATVTHSEVAAILTNDDSNRRGGESLGASAGSGEALDSRGGGDQRQLNQIENSRFVRLASVLWSFIAGVGSIAPVCGRGFRSISQPCLCVFAGSLGTHLSDRNTRRAVVRHTSQCDVDAGAEHLPLGIDRTS